MAVVESRGIIESPDPAQVVNNGYGGLSSLPLSFPREPDGNLEPNDLQQLQRRGDIATFAENGQQNSLQQLQIRSSGATFTKNGEQNSFHTRDNGASFTENGEQNSLQQLHIRGSGAAFTKNGEQNSFQTRDNGASFTENDEQNSLQHLHIRGSGATFTKNGDQNGFQTRDNGAAFTENGEQNSLQPLQIRGGGAAFTENHDGDGSPFDNRNNYSSDSMLELEDFLSNLNPFAKEFVPPGRGDGSLSPFMDNNGGRKKNGSGQGKRRTSSRASRAQREDCVRRTVYVSDIDQQVTEEQLAALFITCGQVVDCRVCGDPNSVLRFAFVEFTDEEGARAALNLSGTMLGYYPVRVLPSKTAIVPVNPTFLPQSEDEREMCSRTIYCTNIDKKVSQADVRLFFESLCGEVSRLRLLGDHHHSTRIAFVEFVQARSAMAALNCSGAILGSLPIRVSPSKTPVRPRFPRTPLFQYAMAFQHVF